MQDTACSSIRVRILIAHSWLTGTPAFPTSQVLTCSGAQSSCSRWYTHTQVSLVTWSTCLSTLIGETIGLVTTVATLSSFASQLVTDGRSMLNFVTIPIWTE